MRRRQRRGAQRLHRHHRRVRARHRRRRATGSAPPSTATTRAENVFPGATEVFDNGVDENCDGRDNPNLDVDRDGFPRRATATTATPRSGRTCPRSAATRSTRTATGAPTRSPTSARSSPTSGCSRRTLRALARLVVHNAPRGARITLPLLGPQLPERRTRAAVRSARALARRAPPAASASARLRAGTRLRVTITAAETIGRTYTYDVKRGAAPATRIVCRAPGQRRGRSC